MNRERTSYRLNISCHNLTNGGNGVPVVLGTTGKTEWRIICLPDEIKLERNDSSEEVMFDILIVGCSFDRASQEFTTSEVLHPGEDSMIFSFRGVLPFASCTGYQGSLKVYSKVLDAFDARNMGSSAESILQKCCGTSSEVSNDFLHLLDDPESFSDAMLKCGDVEMPVHKCILAARSNVFAAMFKNEMLEGRKGVVEIVDMKPDVLRAMLVYMYGGKTDHLNANLAEDLLFCADKYQLEGLKKACRNVFKSNMMRDNIFHYLVLGDMHDTGLKEKAIEFLCNRCHFSKLESTEEWKMLREERPVLAMDVLVYIIKYVQDKWHSPSDTSGCYDKPFELPPFRPIPPLPHLPPIPPIVMPPFTHMETLRQIQRQLVSQRDEQMQLLQQMQSRQHTQPMQFQYAYSGPLRPRNHNEVV